jgi:glucose-6-phosphate isomerase
MKDITFDYSDGFVSNEEIEGLGEFSKKAHNMLHNKEGLGHDYLGWLSLPSEYDQEEFKRVKLAAEKIKKN